MGMTGFFDTNILIDFLNGIEEAGKTFEPFERLCISRITWMEVMVGARETAQERKVRRFLSQFDIVELDEAISEAAVSLRRHHRPKLKLPDAIVLASARETGCRLTTRNTQDFPRQNADIHIPYRLP